MIFIFGKTQYHKVYPIPDVIDPEIIAKMKPYELVSTLSGINKEIGIIKKNARIKLPAVLDKGFF